MLKIIMGTLMLFAFQSSLQAGTAPTLENTTKLYVATFNRAPDSKGLNYWANDAGLDLEGIAQSFFDQPETKEAYPADSNSADFIEAVYLNLFNRAAETAGLEYWVGELDSGRIAKATFILAVINGAKDTEEFGSDATILTNKTTVGLAFANAGLNDTTDAKEIIIGVTNDESTVTAALESYGIVAYTESLTELIVGKTFYTVGSDDKSYLRKTLIFKKDGTLDIFTGVDNVFEESLTYEINPEGTILSINPKGGHAVDDRMTEVWEGEDTEHIYYELENVQKLNDQLLFTDDNLENTARLFFTVEAAKNALDRLVKEYVVSTGDKMIWPSDFSLNLYFNISHFDIGNMLLVDIYVLKKTAHQISVPSTIADLENNEDWVRIADNILDVPLIIDNTLDKYADLNFISVIQVKGNRFMTIPWLDAGEL